MSIFSLVADHTRNDLETLARLSTSTQQLSEVIETHPLLQGAVVLSTCNRVELYADVGDHQVDEAITALVNAVSVSSGLDAAHVGQAFKFFPHDPTVRHLFEVGSGLKSAVVGEREIAGQVRRALGEAREAGTSTGGLTKLFEAASRTAKSVANTTALGSTGRSIVSVALDLATELRAGTSESAARNFWSQANVLMVGTGAYAGTTFAQLEQRGAQNVAVHSSSGRAQQFVDERGGWAMALGGDSVRGAFAEADVLIGVSGGDRTVTAEQLAALREHTDRPLTVVDLALTHDFDPAIADIDGVDLITLESVKMAAPEEQYSSVARAHSIVDLAVEDYLVDRRERSAADAIVALREHAMDSMRQEMTKVREQHGCTAAAEEVNFAMRRMVRQFLHAPTVRARQMAADGRLEDYEQALEIIFGLDVSKVDRHNAVTDWPMPGAGHELSSEHLSDHLHELGDEQSA